MGATERVGGELTTGPGPVITPKLTTKENGVLQKITPFLWFDNNAESWRGAILHVGFKNSRILQFGQPLRATRAGPKGSVMVRELPARGPAVHGA